MPIEVVIKMDKVPSRDNQKVMKHLIENVDSYKTELSMRVELIPRAKKQVGEAAIYIGRNPPVRGYPSIIPELKKAYARASALGSSDQVSEFWKEGLKKEPGETDSSAPMVGGRGRESGGLEPPEDLATRFTRATAEREKRRPQKGLKNPAAAQHAGVSGMGNSPNLSKPITAIGDSPAERAHTRKIVAQSTPGPQDNTECASMERDPVMAKYWANQFETSGC